jgi:hypothetical protein
MVCGTFLEGKMENKNRKDAVADRRDFLKRSAVSVAAAGVVAVAGKTASASEVEAPTGSGYRETEHVKAFYASARF